MRGDGYYVRGGMLYVDGFVGVTRYRKSTGLGVSKKNVAFVSKNHQRILEDIVAAEKRVTFTSFGLDVIESGSEGRALPYHKELKSKFLREINPYFKHLEFNDIKPLMVEKWQNSLMKTYNVNTVRKYSNILKRIFTKAVANDLCDKNPFDGVSSLKGEKSKCRGFYTEEDISKILQGASGWFQLFLVTAFGTAMRTGELLALKWDDVDFEKNTITVGRSITHSVIKSTKTNQVRTIDMLDIVKDALLKHREEAKCEWIFPNKDLTPYTESKNILKYYFKPLLEKVGVEYKTLYVSRHSFISLMLNRGMDLMWVQNMAGHASSTTTLKYYALFDTTNKTRLNKANNILNNGTLVAQTGIC